MMQKTMVAVCAVLAALFLAMGSAKAERLGGAYRGPYSENFPTKEEDSTEVGEAPADSTPDAPEENEGKEPDDSSKDPGEDPSPGEDPPSGPSSEDPPPPTGDDTPEPGSKQPTDPGTGRAPGLRRDTGKVGPGDTGRRTAVEDVQAYWLFWFEHNKEWLLGELLSARTGGARVPAQSSVWWFSQDGSERPRTPLTEKDRSRVILPLLIESLTHKSSWVRDAAVFALGKLGTPEVVPHIAGRLFDTDEDVREDALLALGLTGQKEALQVLLQNLKKADSRKPFAALGLGLLGREEALAPLYAEYRAALDAREEQVASSLAVAIGMLGDETWADRLAAPLRNRRGNTTLKVYVCQALGRLGGASSKKWLLRAWGERDRNVKAAAVLALSNYPDYAVVKSLLGGEGLKSGDRMTKLFTLISLGRIGKTLEEKNPARKLIRQELKDFAETPQRDPYMAAFASLSIAMMGEGIANRSLLAQISPEMHGKGTTETRAAAAMALGILGEPLAVGDLRSLVRGQAASTQRGYASLALGLLGDVQAKEDIKSEFLKDRRHELLRSGCWAVGLLGDKNDLDWLLGCLTMEGSDKHSVRGAAAIGIGLIGDRAAVAPLVKMAKEDVESSNRAFAIAALGCLIDENPVPRVAQIFKSINYKVELPVARDVLKNL